MNPKEKEKSSSKHANANAIYHFLKYGECDFRLDDMYDKQFNIVIHPDTVFESRKKCKSNIFFI